MRRFQRLEIWEKGMSVEFGFSLSRNFVYFNCNSRAWVCFSQTIYGEVGWDEEDMIFKAGVALTFFLVLSVPSHTQLGDCTGSCLSTNWGWQCGLIIVMSFNTVDSWMFMFSHSDAILLFLKRFILHTFKVLVPSFCYFPPLSLIEPALVNPKCVINFLQEGYLPSQIIVNCAYDWEWELESNHWARCVWFMPCGIKL